MNHDAPATSTPAETSGEAATPLRPSPEWTERLPWVVQGTTTRTGGSPLPAEGPPGGPPEGPPGGASEGGSESVKMQSDHDMRLWGSPGAHRALLRWDALASLPGIHAVVHARQVHGAALRLHRDVAPGVYRSPEADGHLTATPGVLLAVTVADCVPVFLAGEHAGRRGVALLHAGWRGVAAGIVEAGILALEERLGIPPAALHLHLGPAISGARYEVGPEVFQGLGLPTPPGPAHLDLRGVVAERALAAGVPDDTMSLSTICTATDPLHYSHRGGDQGRQVAVLGIRAHG